MRDNITPALRSFGATGSGHSFALPSERALMRIFFQRRTMTDGEVRFTVNLFVADKDDWEAFRAQHPEVPRPTGSRSIRRRSRMVSWDRLVNAGSP